MKKEVIALAFSDIHLNNWTKFNQNGSRTDSHFLILDKIFREAIKQKIPVFFLWGFSTYSRNNQYGVIY